VLRREYQPDRRRVGGQRRQLQRREEGGRGAGLNELTTVHRHRRNPSCDLKAESTLRKRFGAVKATAAARASRGERGTRAGRESSRVSLRARARTVRAAGPSACN